jgi:hypothetical protein
MNRILALAGVLLALAVPLPVVAIPQPGHYFYGDVTSRGQAVPAGSPIVAVVVGPSLQYSTTVDVQGRYGYAPNFFNIPADDPWTPEREGARPGEPIQFYVNGRRFWLYDVEAGRWSGSYPFEIGGTTHLNLEACAPHSTFLAAIFVRR